MEQNSLLIGITVSVNCDKVVFILTSLCSLILSGVMMLLLNVMAMKYKKKWLSQWAMCLSVLFGIVVGAVTNALV